MVGKLFIVSASSGAGKTTLVNALLQRIQPIYDIKRVVTYTTRAPRPGELDGIDYCFISVEKFESHIKQGFFLEWSNIYGAYYGSPYSIVDEISQGRSYIAILDRSGAKQALNSFHELVLIWIYTDIVRLRNRLMERRTETFEQIEHRIQLAKKEIEEENLKKLYKFHINNNDFNRAIEEFELIVTSLL